MRFFLVIHFTRIYARVATLVNMLHYFASYRSLSLEKRKLFNVANITSYRLFSDAISIEKMIDETKKLRLTKAIANTGYCSR